MDGMTMTPDQPYATGLTRSNIECRQWYGSGVLAQPHFQHLSHDSLEITDHLAPLLIGLPVAADLSDEEIDRVASALEEVRNP